MGRWEKCITIWLENLYRTEHSGNRLRQKNNTKMGFNWRGFNWLRIGSRVGSIKDGKFIDELSLSWETLILGVRKWRKWNNYMLHNLKYNILLVLLEWNGLTQPNKEYKHALWLWFRLLTLLQFYILTLWSFMKLMVVGTSILQISSLQNTQCVALRVPCNL
jgi:hypothetical protein